MKTLLGSDDTDPEPPPRAGDRSGADKAAQRLASAIDRVLIDHGAPAELVSEMRRDLQILAHGPSALRTGPLERMNVERSSAPLSWSTGLGPVADYARTRLARHAARLGPSADATGDRQCAVCAACWPVTPWPCDKARRAAEALLVVEFPPTADSGNVTDHNLIERTAHSEQPRR